MSRILFFALLVLNLLAGAGLLGWLGSRVPVGEPERLTNQLKPEAIRLLPPEALVAAPASAPEPLPEPAPAPVAAPEPIPAVVTAPQACMRFTQLTDAHAQNIAALAQQLAGEVVVADEAELVPSSWWVHVPPLASRGEAEAKVAEIRALGVSDLFILQDEGPFQYAISLGLFKTEASANLHLSRLRAKGVRSGIITARGNKVHVVELRGPANVLSSFASDLEATLAGVERQGCEP